jgi:hypothetical protein
MIHSCLTFSTEHKPMSFHLVDVFEFSLELLPSSNLLLGGGGRPGVSG